VDLTFIGTATVLLRVGDLTVLTDPNFLHQGDHAPLGGGLRSRRLTDPAMELEDLPPIDLCVLSHHHGDHFDPYVVEHLDKDLPIVTEPRSARKLGRQGFRAVIPLATWQRHRVERGATQLDVTAMPGKHSPRLLGPLVPPVMGSMLEVRHLDRPPFRIYVSGDTLLHDRLAEVPSRYPDIDLCLVHLGGTRVAGILLTMDADQGVRFLRLVAPKAAVPIHVDDYTVFKSPLDDFRRAVAAADLTTEVRYVERGETITFGP
jgi:L-ascorbate metabolism protein UlaG (beta-lactamase superfamily)